MNPLLSTSPRRRASRLAGLALGVLATLALLAPGTAHAQDSTASRKFGRGLAAITVGFLEIPGNVVQESRAHGPLYGVTLGLAMGIGKFVTRELVGVYEVLSAPFEVPDGFVPILAPEFPWQYFDGAGSGLSGVRGAVAAIPDTTLTERDEGLVVTLSNELLFPIGSSNLSAASKGSLDLLADALREHARVTVTVLGYTDNTGSPATNRRLSAERAEAVARQLTNQGVDPARVVTQGLADGDPVASNDTAAGRRLNRRVEVVLR